MRLVPEIKKHADPYTLILSGPSTREQKWSLPFYLGGSYTVRFIPHTAVLRDYFNDPNQIIFLSTDKYATQEVKNAIGPRIKILARQKEMTLMEIAPAPRTLPVTFPSTLPATTQPGTAKIR
jgi:hypothetical protein